MSTTRKDDWATAKSLVREWLLEKGVALTGVNGEASRSTVNRFKLDLAHRIVMAITAERERAAKIAETYYSSGGQYIAQKIREGKPRE